MQAPRRGDQFPQSLNFCFENTSARLGERVGFALAVRAVRLRIIHPLDPVLLQQALERAIQGAGAQHDALIAEHLNIFHDGIAMPGPRGKAQENEQSSLAEGRLEVGSRLGANRDLLT